MKSKFLYLAILITGLLLFLNCKKESTSAEIPDITISSGEYSVVEDDASASIRLTVFLSDAYDKPVTIDYATEDSTAVVNKNYRAATGTLTMNPGEKSKAFTVNIVRDTVGKEDVYFKVLLSNPQNAVLNQATMIVRIKNVDYNNLVWSDEFTDVSLNTAWWNYELGNNNGWGNNELENYTNDIANTHLDSGYLHITALKSGSSYTSARLTTKGKKEFTYGRIAIRARMPYGQGIWPALWMLGANISEVNWPKCGEIDMMEFLGHETNKVYGTVHWDENGHKYLGGNTTLTTGNFKDEFHIFTLVWTPNRFEWSVDNKPYYELKRATISNFPFDLPEFFIFNVAVGGNWPGMPDGSTTFPQHMIVDYIRVYQ